MKLRISLFAICSVTLFSTSVFASGYGVFTQGASALGQANAVVAHPTGPSSLYFNPALINDVPGRQVEIGTTAIISKREIDLDSGDSEQGDETNFPSTLYYTHNSGGKFAAGLGVFFPFGLSNSWDSDYEGRYIGTSGEMTSLNFNPAFSYRVTDKLSLAAGFNMLYIDTELEAMVNQSFLLSLDPGTVPDISQAFDGEGWGHGYNLGLLYKASDRFSFGAAYRSKVDVDIEGDLRFTGLADPGLALLLPNSMASIDIELPAQFVAGIASQITDRLIVEVGARWEDWNSNKQMVLDVEFGRDITQIRDWRSTWAYNIGMNYKLNDAVSINLGYLFAENPVPDSTFEPIIPDSDAHLFTIGTDIRHGNWTVSGAFGYEHHDSRTKANDVGDPVVYELTDGAVITGTADGEYETDIYLVGLSLGYKF